MIKSYVVVLGCDKPDLVNYASTPSEKSYKPGSCWEGNEFIRSSVLSVFLRFCSLVCDKGDRVDLRASAKFDLCDVLSVGHGPFFMVSSRSSEPGTVLKVNPIADQELKTVNQPSISDEDFLYLHCGAAGEPFKF